MLLTNSLFLDSEYKADCEFKINYLSIINKKDKGLMESIEDKDLDGDIDREDLINCLERKVIEYGTRPYISDGEFLYTTRQISDNYYKILLEEHKNNN